MFLYNHTEFEVNRMNGVDANPGQTDRHTDTHTDTAPLYNGKIQASISYLVGAVGSAFGS